MSKISLSSTYNHDFTFVIFSKNRACQLDLLLRSIDLNFEDYLYDIIVLCKHSNGFSAGYKKLETLHPKVIFIEEFDFRSQLRTEIEHAFSDFIIFCVDDDVFIRPVFIDDMLDRMAKDGYIRSISTRLSPFIDFWYEKWEEVKQPEFLRNQVKNGYLVLIDKKFVPGGWASCYSLDGNIFRKIDAFEMVSRLSYSTPNTLEAAMKKYMLDDAKDKMNYLFCGKQSYLVGVPLNVVQGDWRSRYSTKYGVSPEYLESQWINGFRISLTEYQKITPHSVHIEFPEMRFERGL